ncbi:MAG: FAD:protein FMN transferase, partial [Muribaculaceae bacterium]|nr:FAD:protein FMN transferase [Muribaculaceae bacterium]
NTTYHIVYRADKILDDSIQACFSRINKSVSAFDNSSTISRINRNETVITDTMFRSIFTMAQQINSESSGMFDPTVSPLINLWGYGYTGHTDSIPNDSLIEKALSAVGIADCLIAPDGTISKKDIATEFNFSALAKGFGCDEVGRMLRRNGCNNYMIEIGGEIALHGTNPHNRTWYIMIDAPIDNALTPTHIGMRTIRATDCGLATSGNYRNYRDTSRGRTSHTINPITGYPTTFLPSDTLILSATVIAPTAMEADALATACMCMAPSQALSMIKSKPGRSALLVVDRQGAGHTQSLHTDNFPQPE